MSTVVQLPPGVPDFATFAAQRRAERRKKEAKKKERKFFVGPWLPNYAALKGAGFGAHIVATLLTKGGLLATLGVLAAGSAGLGHWNTARRQQEGDEYKRKQFQQSMLREHVIRENEARRNGGREVGSGRSDAVGLVKRGELDGATGLGAGTGSGPAQGPAADAAAAGGEAKPGEGAAAPAAGPVDPNAMMESMLAKAGGGAMDGGGASGGREALGSGRFGQLGKGLGGMKGGGGLAGGIGRGFGAGAKALGAGKTEAMKSGKKGGLVDSKVARGRKTAWAARRGISGGARRSASAGRLRKMSGDMQANKPKDVTTSAAANTAAWEDTKASSQRVEGGGSPAADPGTPGGQPPAPTPRGGPTDPDVGGNTDFNKDAVPPDVGPTTNVTPYQWAVDLAKMILVITLVLCVLAAIYMLSPFFWGIWSALVTIIGILGGVLAMLGLFMMAEGQIMQGVLWTAVGGAVVIAAVTNGAAANWLTMMAIIGISMAIGAAFGGLAAQGDAPPEEDDSDRKDYEGRYGRDSRTGRPLAEGSA